MIKLRLDVKAMEQKTIKRMRVNAGSWRTGFTLLELLFVMAIIAIIAAMTTIGYFANVKAMANKSAVLHLTRNLDFARQTAVMQGRSIYVIFDQDGTNAWYSICRKEGEITRKSGPYYLDVYGDLSGISAGLKVYNLDTGESGLVTTNVSQAPFGWGMSIDPDIFNGQMASYGWEICQRVHLPRGFRFGDGTRIKGDGKTPETVIFTSEGTTGLSDIRIDIVDIAKASTGAGFRFARVTVCGTTGYVETDMNAQ